MPWFRRFMTINGVCATLLMFQGAWVQEWSTVFIGGIWMAECVWLYPKHHV